MDELSVKSEHKRKAMVVSISGRVDSVTAAALEEQLARIAQEHHKIVLDLKNTGYLSSAGVRAIIRMSQSVQKAGGGLVLANVTGLVAEVLQTVGVTEKLPVYRSVEEAAGSF
jgi:anti-anti-sigma factor